MISIMENFLTYFNWKIVFLFIFAIIFQKFIIKPYLLIKYYEKQGLPSTFIPFLGKMFFDVAKGITQHNDAIYFQKKRIQANPKLKGFITNVGSDVIIDLIDPKYIKDFFAKQDQMIKYERFSSLYKEVLGDGLAFIEGPSWKKRR